MTPQREAQLEDLQAGRYNQTKLGLQEEASGAGAAAGNILEVGGETT